MNTPSHWLMTIVAGKVSPWRDKIPKWSLGLGSIAPDIPLYFLSFGGIFFYSVVKGWPSDKTFPHLYSPEGLYFNDPAWIGLHNLFHSPTSLILMAILAFSVRRLIPRLSRWFLFFLSACGFHSLIDILTHHDDGPLLFFPFDWQTRFESPVSYWDSGHHGGTFMVFEGILVLLLVGYLIVEWRQNRRNQAES